MLRTIATCVLVSALACAPQVVFGASAAAEVTSLKGSANAISRAQVSRALRTGASVFEGERVQTGDGSAISLRFADGTKFDLGADAMLKVDEFKYGKEVEEDSIATSILKGAFRFVSGLIAKRRKRSMSVFLPVVTIGIRGTTVAGEATATSATVILLESEEPQDTPPEIEVSNQFGSVTIDQPGFGTDVPDQFSPPSPPRRMRLNTINNIVRSLQTIQRIRIPNVPRMRRP